MPFSGADMNGTMYRADSVAGADEANEVAGFAMGPRGVPKDPKLLTKSTINNNEAAHFNGVQHSASFGPTGGAPGFGGAYGPGPGSGMELPQLRVPAGVAMNP